MIYDTYNDLATPSMSGEEIHSVWEQDEDTIDHVIFVIHGIGQQTERFGYFEQHMETIRKTICEVLQARMPYRDIRIQLIPIEWHKHIHEQTDSCLNNISLESVPGMRLVSNDYMMDALYYLAKDRQQSIVSHVTQTFNDTYHEFIDTHPTFQGNIGIFGYSLGGIITWDILSHQRTIETMEEQAQLNKLDLRVPHLDFKPQFLFGVGCPLGAFLNIRNQDPKLYHPDDSTIFENIYHPCDPLAYRVEPLYHPDCRQHDSIQVEAAIPSDHATPLFTSLTGWVTSCRRIPTSITTMHPRTPLATTTTTTTTTNTAASTPWSPQQPPTIVNDPMVASATAGMDTPSLIATSNTNYPNHHQRQPSTPSSIDCPLTQFQGDDCMPLNGGESHHPMDVDHDDDDDNKNGEPSDRATLLSSVGALFQYISPRASFDRDSAIGSDIEEEDEDDNGNDHRHKCDQDIDMPSSYSSVTFNHHQLKKMKRRSAPLPSSSCMNTSSSSSSTTTSPPGAPTNPGMLYRRRQSQIYDTNTMASFSVQKKRRQSLPNLRPLQPEASSLEEDEALLQTLPGSRRVDYALQPGPMLGGMISNQYLLGFQAHFSYWNNKDMLWRMVDQLDNAIH
ncbi:DDHD domain-domain-containing protein [Absidia repens]|uniref:DDHD domain-domain-containing protein n=1 Tax=Absidia repens TaxID=90262 RepID=A0A1X2IL05_9FUNG|nr:DDHD domain-domain-containing protein [Absidia repens]